MISFFDELENLHKRFSINELQDWRPEAERWIVDDSMSGVQADLRWNIHDGIALGDREKAAHSSLRIAEHYYSNVQVLLSFVLDDLQEYREGTKRAWPHRLRLRLDFEKLLTDTRSMLDSLYCVALLYQPDVVQIPAKRRKSFGKFSDWYQTEPPKAFCPPLSILVAAMHWAQDIRSLRDGYIHNGHESQVFYGDTELYLDPHSHRSLPRRRVLPDLFYVEGNSNNLLLVEKLLAFIVAPILALRRSLGDNLHSILAVLPGWQHRGIGMPYNEGPGVLRMREWLMRNLDVLDSTNFRQRHFS